MELKALLLRKSFIEDLQKEQSIILAKYDCFCVVVPTLRTWERATVCTCTCKACAAWASNVEYARQIQKIWAQI